MVKRREFAMKIALLVPSRERIGFKRDLARSVLDTVDNINNVNLYFGIDDDDPTKKHAEEIARQYPFVKIIPIHNNGKFDGLGKLWNICARATTEEIMAMIGDDMVFITKGWDTKILDEFSDKKCPRDNIKMVFCYDGRHGERMAVNAFVHRAYMNLTGYFMREEFRVDFIDLWLHQIFASIGRLKYRGDIHIEHRHWSFGKSPVDNVSRNLRGNNYPAISQKLWVSMQAERRKEAEKIGLHLGIKPNLSKIDGVIPG
jgi:hypothetical protein